MSHGGEGRDVVRRGGERGERAAAGIGWDEGKRKMKEGENIKGRKRKEKGVI